MLKSNKKILLKLKIVSAFQFSAQPMILLLIVLALIGFNKPDLLPHSYIPIHRKYSSAQRIPILLLYVALFLKIAKSLFFQYIFVA